MPIHFSLRELLISVAFCAVATVGALYPTPLWASIIFTSTVFILLAALLAAVGSTGSARAYWLGFAIAGWGYLWLAHWTDENYPVDYPDVVPWQLQANGPLVTTKVIRWAFAAIHESSRPPRGLGRDKQNPTQRGSAPARGPIISTHSWHDSLRPPTACIHAYRPFLVDNIVCLAGRPHHTNHSSQGTSSCRSAACLKNVGRPKIDHEGVIPHS